MPSSRSGRHDPDGRLRSLPRRQHHQQYHGQHGQHGQRGEHHAQAQYAVAVPVSAYQEPVDAPHHTYQLPSTVGILGRPGSPSSDNNSDATLTDSELALARDSTLLVHNGGECLGAAAVLLLLGVVSRASAFRVRH
ncbi:uncharacterized protein LOC117651056 isoform X2 [Thrips palmi]|uniref:Uncharacterized protein LOC117651056 isoform X2 n=1 Tax=Thrips palmi TaxID=161013 RepID=A0A6P9A022_THRPL|nr:uncharacterized protein LOC117651056 isoform X2 [Thrips palmi]